MAYEISYRPATPPGYSPYRLVDASGTAVAAVNDFLDAQAARGLSIESLRTYGYSLLNFWRWFAEQPKSLGQLEEADLFDYIRYQRETTNAANTLNHRLTAVRCLYRFHSGYDLPAGRRSFRAQSHPYHNSVASESGYLYPSRRRIPGLRVRTARRVVVPLTPEEVRAFFASLHTWRDLTITALMLFCGLRSREIIGLTLGDLCLLEGRLRVRGKGGKERVVPLPPRVATLLQSHLDERPSNTTENHLFLSLKGGRRGRAMTPAGLRSLFRHHRKVGRVENANPHRFRHTFGADMARAGISMAALMKLMGHADIHTTMIYVELSPKDVWEEFLRVVSPGEKILSGADDGPKE